MGQVSIRELRNHGGDVGEHGGHDRVLGAHHRCLVEEDVPTADPLGLELVDALRADVDDLLDPRL